MRFFLHQGAGQMKLMNAIFGIVVFGIGSCAATAGVTLLGESKTIIAGGLSGQIGSSMAIGLHYFAPGGFGYSIPNQLLFSGLTIGAGDGMTSLVSNSSRDAEFAGFVTLLTNGTAELVTGNGNLGDLYFNPSSDGTPEANFFKLPAGNQGVDFNGFTIDHIDFYVESISIKSMPSEFSETGLFTDYNLSGVFRVFGEKTEVIPEPSSCGMAALGILSLLIRRRGRVRLKVGWYFSSNFGETAGSGDAATSNGKEIYKAIPVRMASR